MNRTRRLRPLIGVLLAVLLSVPVGALAPSPLRAPAGASFALPAERVLPAAPGAILDALLPVLRAHAAIAPASAAPLDQLPSARAALALFDGGEDVDLVRALRLAATASNAAGGDPAHASSAGTIAEALERAEGALELREAYALATRLATAGARDAVTQNAAKLALAEALDARAASGRDDPREVALLALGAQPASASPHELPAIRAFASAADAVASLHASSGEPYVPDGGLARLPPDVSTAIARIVSAHLVQAEATKLALAYPHDDSHSVDLGLLSAARTVAASVVLEAASGLRCVEDGPTNVTSPIFQYDLRCDDSTYTTDAVLLIDAGGDDAYSNNAGGATQGAAMLIDAAGNDTYVAVGVATRGVTGGAAFGSGFLFDAGGDDAYLATMSLEPPTPEILVSVPRIQRCVWLVVTTMCAATGPHHVADPRNATLPLGAAANGGGHHGAGFLFDASGNDVYDASVSGAHGGVNGGAYHGHGALLDGGGIDRFFGRVRVGGVNGGGFEGVGFLYAASGNDAFVGDSERAGAVNGAGASGAAPGSGLLYSGGGGNAYNGTVGLFGAVNGGGTRGSGFLYSAGGDNIYNGSIETHGAVNGGGEFEGAGFLHTGGGRNQYVGRLAGGGGVNGGSQLGSGFLHTLGGNNSYEGAVGFGGVNGGAYLGSAFLLTQGGGNAYAGSVLLTDGVVNGGGLQGVGFLQTIGPENTYVGFVERGGGVNGVGRNGVGVLHTAGGGNVYNGTLRGFGGVNGAAQLGLGFLFTEGGGNLYDGAGYRGGVNGAALNGAGFLFTIGGGNTYHGSIERGGVNGGAMYGTGVLFSRGAGNTYSGDVVDWGGLNGVGVLGTGILYGVGGANTYSGSIPMGGVNGGSLAGLGVLVDRDGGSSFAGRVAGAGGSNGAGGGFGFGVGEEIGLFAGYPGGIGILLAGSGDDTYDSGGTTQGAADWAATTGTRTTRVARRSAPRFSWTLPATTPTPPTEPRTRRRSRYQASAHADGASAAARSGEQGSSGTRSVTTATPRTSPAGSSACSARASSAQASSSTLRATTPTRSHHRGWSSRLALRTSGAGFSSMAAATILTVLSSAPEGSPPAPAASATAS